MYPSNAVNMSDLSDEEEMLLLAFYQGCNHHLNIGGDNLGGVRGGSPPRLKFFWQLVHTNAAIWWILRAKRPYIVPNFLDIELKLIFLNLTSVTL